MTPADTFALGWTLAYAGFWLLVALAALYGRAVWREYRRRRETWPEDFIETLRRSIEEANRETPCHE